MKEWFRHLFRMIEDSRFAPMLQFIKFGLVGVSNTLISYIVEMLGYYVFLTGWAHEQGKVITVTALSFVISTMNAYYWNNRYVFQGDRHTWRRHLAAYLRAAACYALTGLLLAPAVKLWLVQISVPFWIASLSTLVLTIPLNFILNKFWAFKA